MCARRFHHCATAEARKHPGALELPWPRPSQVYGRSVVWPLISTGWYCIRGVKEIQVQKLGEVAGPAAPRAHVTKHTCNCLPRYQSRCSLPLSQRHSTPCVRPPRTHHLGPTYTCYGSLESVSNHSRMQSSMPKVQLGLLRIFACQHLMFIYISQRL